MFTLEAGMFRIFFLSVLLCLSFISSAFACSCIPFTDTQRIEKPAAIIPEARVVKMERGSQPGWPVVTLKVLLSGKGAKEGETIKAIFTNENSCSRGIPRIGQTLKFLVLVGNGDIPHAEDGCINFPSTSSGVAALVGYRSRWLALEEKARIAPYDVNAQLALGNFLAEWRDNRNALTAYSRALKLSPQDRAIELKVAAMETRLLHFADARRLLGRLSAIEPTNGLVQLMQIQLAGREKWHNRKTHKPYYISLTAPALAEQNVSGVELTNIELTGVKAPRSQWKQADIIESAMPQADLIGADLSSARFRKTDLSGATLVKASAENVEFVDSILRDLQAQDARATGADFSGATLIGSNFKGADLTGANFDTADISGVDFSGAELRNVNFSFAKIDCATQFPDGFVTEGRQLLPTETCNGRYTFDFSGIDFGNAPWRKGRPVFSGWKKVSFEGRDLRGARFDNARFRYDFSFRKADLRGASFAGTHLNQASFSDADARKSHFIYARGKADFSGADLSGSILFGAHGLRIYGDNPPQSERLEIQGSPPKLTGAFLRYVDIALPVWSDTDASQNLESFLDAKIEHAIIDCTMILAKPVPKKGEPTTEKKWKRAILALDAVRRVITRNTSNKASSRCAAEIATYLGNDCREGRAKAGFAYTCPAPP